MRATSITLTVWPRLLSVKTAATYSGVGPATIRDWIAAGVLTAVPMPGSTLRNRHGKTIAAADRRRIAKILIDRTDLDRLIDERKGTA